MARTFDSDAETVAALCLDAVAVRFAGLVAIDGVTLSLQRGGILGLIGPNGAGKTTLVNVLTGFQAVASGQIRLGSRNLTGSSPHMRARAGIVRTFQGVRLFREYSVHRNLLTYAIGAGLCRRDAERQTERVLGWSGLGAIAERRADTLAYGDERRVGIARALAGQPSFVLLDEPAAGMTDRECDDLMATISEIPAVFGCGVLLIEHNMRLVMGVCQRIHVIDFGRTIAEGAPAEIQRDPKVLNAYLGTRATNHA